MKDTNFENACAQPSHSPRSRRNWRPRVPGGSSRGGTGGTWPSSCSHDGSEGRRLRRRSRAHRTPRHRGSQSRACADPWHAHHRRARARASSACRRRACCAGFGRPPPWASAATRRCRRWWRAGGSASPACCTSRMRCWAGPTGCWRVARRPSPPRFPRPRASPATGLPSLPMWATRFALPSRRCAGRTTTRPRRAGHSGCWSRAGVRVRASSPRWCRRPSRRCHRLCASELRSASSAVRRTSPTSSALMPRQGWRRGLRPSSTISRRVSANPTS